MGPSQAVVPCLGAGRVNVPPVLREMSCSDSTTALQTAGCWAGARPGSAGEGQGCGCAGVGSRGPGSWCVGAAGSWVSHGLVS